MGWHFARTEAALTPYVPVSRSRFKKSLSKVVNEFELADVGQFAVAI